MIKERVEKFLKEFDMPVTVFCKKAEISTATYYQWVKGKLKLSEKTEKRIEQFLSKYEINELSKKVMELINEYSENHKLAKSCGSDYIFQSDRAQVDALKLVGDIFDLYTEEYEDEYDE